MTSTLLPKVRRLLTSLTFVAIVNTGALNAISQEVELEEGKPTVEFVEPEMVNDDDEVPTTQIQRRDADIEQVIEQVSLQLLADKADALVADESGSDPIEVPAAASNEQPSGKVVDIDGKKVLTPSLVQHRWEEGSFDWIFRDGDNGLGMFSLQSTSSRELAFDDPSNFDIGFDFSIHFLSGPLKSDLPPRLFDLYFNVHWLQQLGDGIGFDANFDLGLYTDFEDTVGKGWRYPGRALAFWNLDGNEGTDEVSELTLLGGLEFFDTAKLRVLPAGGLIWQPDESTRYELYYPRPQIKWRLSHDDKSDFWLYLRGELMASAWAIERSNGDGDVVSLSEKRIALGLESRSWEPDGDTSFIEIGYVFDRRLEYGSGRGNAEPSSAMMFRMGSRY